MPFLLEASSVLATFVHPNHIVYYAHGMKSLAAYLQLQVVLVYLFSATTYLLKYHLCF
ncbi:RNA polymerase subunit sigma-70 [Vibrio paracholerae]|nr:RNA polymerase subunit sigma-70 [Vibrio paracholerae]